MNFITVTSIKGYEICVNVDNILCFQNGYIWLAGGKDLYVTETYDELREKIMICRRDYFLAKRVY